MAGPERFYLQFEDAARFHVRDASRWYRRHLPSRARTFEAAFGTLQASLQAAPLRWAEFEAGYRRTMLPGFPYWVIYRVEGEVVTVVAVVHQRRRPGVWRVRGPCGG